MKSHKPQSRITKILWTVAAIPYKIATRLFLWYKLWQLTQIQKRKKK